MLNEPVRSAFSDPWDAPRFPRIPGPWGEPPEVDEAVPLTPAERASQRRATIAFAAVTSAAAVALVRGWRQAGAYPVRAAAAVGGATYTADLVSGLLHWALDTYFDDQAWKPLRRVVFIVREHHARPARIFRYGLGDEVGTMGWFGLAAAAPLYTGAVATRATPARSWPLTLAGVTLSCEVTFMLWFHKWGHRARRGRSAALLQRGGILLSPELHTRHHSGRHDSNYCLINGVADRTLGRLGLFRGAERFVKAVTGAEPREDDHVWAARYGRPA